MQYGGRVTDDMDKRLLNTFARIWFGESMFGDKFCFYKGYTIPQARMLQDYHAHIDTLPLVDTPEVIQISIIFLWICMGQLGGHISYNLL